MLNRQALNSQALNGLKDNFFEASLTHEVAEVSATQINGFLLEAEISHPAPSTSGLLLPDDPYVLIEHDVHEVSGEIAVGLIFEADLLQPGAAVEADIINRIVANLTHPLAEVSSSVLKAWYSNLSQPAAIVASMLASPAAPVALMHPRARVSISVVMGNVFGAELAHPVATVALDEGFALHLNHPAAEIAASLVGNIMAEVAVMSPRHRVSAQLALMVETVFRTFAMNTENAKVTEYTNYDTLAIVRIGNAYAAICPDGIYQIGTEDDSGQPVDALVRFGKDDMGSDYLKRLQYAYLGGRGSMGLRMHADHGKVSPEYSVTHDGVDTGTSRVKMGKGLKSRYWQPEISNVDGADMEIDALNLIGEQTSRRVS